MNSLKVRINGLVSIPSQAFAFEKEGMSLAKLTTQEQYILLLVSEGKSNREIASAMFLSSETVKANISDMLEKLNMSNRTQLALFAIELNLRN